MYTFKKDKVGSIQVRVNGRYAGKIVRVHGLTNKVQYEYHGKGYRYLRYHLDLPKFGTIKAAKEYAIKRI